MRILIAIAFTSAWTTTVNADSWRDYLHITCEPLIEQFSVYPTVTWNFRTPPPTGFYPIGRGAYREDGTLVEPRAKETDRFVSCKVSDAYSTNISPKLTFNVIRTKVFETGHCGGCGSLAAEFEIRLNGKSIVSGVVGREGKLRMKSVRYDRDRVTICDAPPDSYRLNLQPELFDLSCRSSRASDLLSDE